MLTRADNFWPTARQFAEAVQCPAICFADPYLKGTQPAIDRLGMPLVTSGQFAYVFKLKSPGGAESVAVRCFRGYLGDREARYTALDERLNAHHVPALPRFRYWPEGILVGGRKFPVLVMQWVEGPTLDVYLEEAVGRKEVLLHLADEWVRLISTLREAGVAHGDLQHGNIIVEHGQLRLVDLDGMFVPRMAGWSASEVGHQHYQHPARDKHLFGASLDNFSALVIYLSLISLAERPGLWDEYHDENLLFTKSDFAEPESSALFSEIKTIGPEHRRLAEVLETAARNPPSETPSLPDLVSVQAKLPSWMLAPPDVEVSTQTREVARAEVQPLDARPEVVYGVAPRQNTVPSTPGSYVVQSIFNSPPQPAGSRAASLPAPVDPSDIRGNSLMYAKRYFSQSFAYLWVLPLNNLLRFFWQAFGAEGEAAALIMTVMFLTFAFLVAGLARALYEAETSTPVSQPAGTLPAGMSQSVTAPLLASATTVPPTSAATLFTPTAKQPDAPVVGNRSLMIYHRPDCQWVDKISDQHRLKFPSAAEAQLAGYRACKVCTPERAAQPTRHSPRS